MCLPQDVAFPYMLHPGHAVDTFIVMEADFRWFEEECIDPSVWLPLVTGKVGLKEVKTEESGALAQMQIRQDPAQIAHTDSCGPMQASSLWRRSRRTGKGAGTSSDSATM